MPVLATTVLSGLLVLAAYGGPVVVALVVVGIAAALAGGLVLAAGLAEPALAILVPTVVAALAAGTVLVVEPESIADLALGATVWALGLAVVLALLAALARERARETAVRWVAVTGAAAVAGGLLAGQVVLVRAEAAGPSVVVAGVIGVVAGVGTAVPASRRPPGLWSLAAALVGAAGLVWGALPGLDLADRLALGGAAAVVAGVVAAAIARATPTVAWAARSASVAGAALATATPAVVIVAVVLLT